MYSFSGSSTVKRCTVKRCASRVFFIPLLVFIPLLLAGAPAADAQIGVYAMGNGGFLGSADGRSGFSAYGGTFGIYDNLVRLGPVKLGADARYFEDTSSNGNPQTNGNTLHGGLAGLRLALNLPLLPFKPYVQAEAGGVGTNYGTQPNTLGVFAYQVQGGLDYTVFPHLDLRAEYGAGNIRAYGSNDRQTLQEAGLGAVLRF